MENNKRKLIIILVIVVSLLVVSSSLIILNKSSDKNYKDKDAVNESNTEKEINKDSKNNNSKDDNKENSNDNSNINSNAEESKYDKKYAVNTFDFEKMISDIHEKVKSNNLGYYLEKCKTKEETSDMSSTFDVSYNELSEKSLLTIVEKLKSAKEYEIIRTASFFCPPYSYSIGKLENGEIRNPIFSLHYNISTPEAYMLILFYNNDGYAFSYNAGEVVGLLENLK